MISSSARACDLEQLGQEPEVDRKYVALDLERMPMWSHELEERQRANILTVTFSLDSLRSDKFKVIISTNL